MSTPNEQNGQQDAGKVKKKFEYNLVLLTAIFAGNANGPAYLAGKDKVQGSEVSNLVDELLGEELEEKRVALKGELKTLVKAKTQFDRDIANEKKKLIKFEEDKMKEFNAKAETIFKNVEGLDQLRNEYARTLGQAAGVPEAPDNISTEE